MKYLITVAGLGICSDYCQQSAGDSCTHEEIFSPSNGSAYHYKPDQRRRVLQGRGVMDTHLSTKV